MMGSNKLLVKARALKACLQFCLVGADFRSCRVLLYVGILASIWPARRKTLLRHLQAFIQKQAPDGLVQVRLRLRARGIDSDGTPIVFRAGDRADYQTMWECLNKDVYHIPGTEIRHVFDGGANIGLFSLSLLLQPNVKDVIVVEPNPANLSLLRRNVSFLPPECIIPAALSPQEGEAYFETAESNTGHLTGAPAHVAGSGRIRVSCRRLINLIPPSWDSKHTWIKLDIEGAEYAVLQDLLTSTYRPAALSLEIHEYPTAGGPQLVKDLEAAGYQIEMMDPGDPKNSCRQVTALFTGSR
jgi:FkbM family methyltransferase